MYHPSYNIGVHEVWSTGYQQAIKQNILKSRSTENIYLLTSGINMDQETFIPIDTSFKPFDLSGLLEKNKGSSYSHNFAPLSDPDLEQIIRDHPVEIDKRGNIGIYVKSYIETPIGEDNLIKEDRTDPLLWAGSPIQCHSKHYTKHI